MLCISVTPFRLIWKIGGKDVEYQSNEFSGSKCKGSFMLMGSRLLIFFPIILTENTIIFSHSICCFSEVISQVFIRGFRHSFVLGCEVSGLIFWPDKACEFSELVMGLKFFNISDLSDDSSCEYFTHARDSSKSIRERFKFFGYSFINFFKVISKGSNSTDKISEDKGEGSGEFGTQAVRFSDCFLNELGDFLGFRASIFTFLRDKRGEFCEGKANELFWREGGKQGGDSMTNERFHGLRLNYCGVLKEKIREEGVDFSNNSFYKMISVAGKGFKRRVRVIGHMRRRKRFRETEVICDSFSIGFISFIKFRERLTKAVKTQSIKSINLSGEGRELFRFGEEISEMPVIDTCRFSSDKDRRDRLWRFGDKFKEKEEEGLSSRRAVRETLWFRDCISHFISDKRDKFFRIHIQTDKKGTHCFTSFVREEGKKEEESWCQRYRAASRISTSLMQRSVSRLYPGPGGLTFESKLKCKEDKPIPLFSPSKRVFTRILPFLQYKINFSLLSLSCLLNILYEEECYENKS